MQAIRIKSIASWLIFLIAITCPLATAAKPADIEMKGELKIRFNNCSCPEHQIAGPEISYVMTDAATKTNTELDLNEEQIQQFKVGRPVTLRGAFVKKEIGIHEKRMDKAFKPTHITYEEASIEEDSADAAEEKPSGGSKPPISKAATNTVNLQTLIIHANTADTTADANKIQNMEDMVFNDPDNMSDCVFAASYGHYRLSHGPLKSVTVELPSTTASSTSAGAMETLMVNALPAAFAAAGQTFNAGDYDRFMFCMPNGTPGVSTAYGYYSGDPRHTVYSYAWTGTTFDGILHELGHNFGFRHSGMNPGVKYDEYQDRTCVMGFSHTGKGNVTATYGAVKKLQNGWFGPFPNTETTISQDVTFDLYPVSQDPDGSPGMRCVKISGYPNHYVSYRRRFDPYAWLRYDSDKDKVYVHSNSSFGSVTWREAGLTSGSYTAGNTQVIFERYGPNNEYATVSFDTDDGNAKPVATAQNLDAIINTDLGITLSGTDADTGPPDTLSFDVVTNPTNGSLSGSPPNLTYTPNTDYMGADSFVFKVNDGKISSFGTISITINEVNTPPEADNQSVNAFFETAEPITLTASDANGHSLIYSVVAGPSDGTLSGTPPNLTYTPDNSFSDSDSFTFKVNDGFEDSNIATVSITVSASSNTAPSVTINTPNQTIPLVIGAGGGDPVSGAYFEWDAAAAGTPGTPVSNLWTSNTSNSYSWQFDSGSLSPGAVSDSRFDKLTHAYSFPSAKDSRNTSFNGFGSGNSATFEFVIDVDGNNGTIFETGGSGDGLQIDVVNGVLRGTVEEDPTEARTTYDLTATDLGRFIHVVFVADNVNNVVKLYVDGDLKDTQDWSAGDIWSGTDDGGLGGQYNSVPDGGSTTDFSGRIALGRYYRNTAFGDSQVTTNFNSLSTGSQAQLTLDATVTDPEHTPTYLWTDTGTGTSSGSANFSDPTSLTPTASFTETGTYVLRLTADDGYDQSFQEITITVDPPATSSYESWAGSFGDGFTDIDPGANPDGDQSSNLMEFAFGTDPTRQDDGPLAINGTRNGKPIIAPGARGTMKLCFVRRSDDSVSYTVQFSSDLGRFTTSSYTPDHEADSSVEGYEVVSVPYPAGSRFGRIEVNLVE